VINRIVQWGSLVFIGSTLAFLVLNRAETISDSSAIERSEMLLVGLSVVTLPLALTKVVREGDPTGNGSCHASAPAFRDEERATILQSA